MARTTISIDGDVFKKGVKRAKALKYKTFSAYVEFLVARDTDEKPSHLMLREESGTHYASKPAAER